jgi:thermitase
MGNRYGPVDATSVAAPIISGVVALMKSIDPALDALRIKNILQSTGFKMPVESACNCRVDVYNIMNILLDKSNKYN